MTKNNHPVCLLTKALEAGVLNKISCLVAPALGMTQFRIVTDMILVTLLYHLSWTRMFNKTTSAFNLDYVYGLERPAENVISIHL